MATTPRQRIAAILRSHTAKRLRFTAPTTWVGDITIDQTTFETVAKAIDDIRIQITVQPRAAFPPGVGAASSPANIYPNISRHGGRLHIRRAEGAADRRPGPGR